MSRNANCNGWRVKPLYRLLHPSRRTICADCSEMIPHQFSVTSETGAQIVDYAISGLAPKATKSLRRTK
jgi:hypothetical protein